MSRQKTIQRAILEKSPEAFDASASPSGRQTSEPKKKRAHQKDLAGPFFDLELFGLSERQT